jgi:Zn-dependent peptidase ImmA (M78 family)
MKPNFNYIEERAVNLLKENNLYKPNFDINKLAEKMNVKLDSKILGDNVSGFFVMTDTQKVITYNSKDVPTRKRFTIAHEMGHCILHSKEQPIFIDKSPTVLYRNNASSTGEDYKEREANAFAASLLMPRELLEEQIEKAPHDISKAIDFLAKKFGVSPNAISFRLSNLGYGI